MAKAKKTARKSVKGLKGSLPPGQAKKMMDAFFKRMGAASNAPEFPQAVVHTIDELRAFLDSAEKTINPDPSKPVPAGERGIALVPGFINGSVTTMLVATRFTDDPMTGKIVTINNPVTGIHIKPLKTPKKGKVVQKTLADPLPGDPVDPPVGDNSLDNGSTYP